MMTRTPPAPMRHNSRGDMGNGGQRIWIGIDGGGSKTHAVAIDASERIVGEARGGPSNWTTVPEPQRRQALADALAGLPQAEAVVGCFAGLMRPDQTLDCESVLAELAPDAWVSARPDFHAALAACPDPTDALIIAGTGSLIASEEDGKVQKSGGGGWRLGDHASATAIGRAALSELTMPTRDWGDHDHAALWDGVEAVYGTRRFREIIGELYADEAPAARLATLAPSVLRVAYGPDADPLAAWVVDDQFQRLAGQVALHLCRWRPNAPAYTLRLTGGVWSMAAGPAEALGLAVARLSGVPTTPVLLDVAPALGAARLARRLTSPL